MFLTKLEISVLLNHNLRSSIVKYSKYQSRVREDPDRGHMQLCVSDTAS